MADYYSLISRAVSGLLINTDEAHREIYDRARTALKERLRTLDPPISETQLANEQAALEAAIRDVETQFLPASFGDASRVSGDDMQSAVNVVDHLLARQHPFLAPTV